MIDQISKWAVPVASYTGCYIIAICLFSKFVYSISLQSQKKTPHKGFSQTMITLPPHCLLDKQDKSSQFTWLCVIDLSSATPFLFFIPLSLKNKQLKGSELNSITFCAWFINLLFITSINQKNTVDELWCH